MSHISIFLSYARGNVSLAIELERALEATGVKVWRDQEKLYAGAQWPKDLGDAVAAQDALLLLWTEPAARSK